MTHTVAEQAVKMRQKEFLIWAEENPALQVLDAKAFNTLRRRVFRGTFEAFRLGILGHLTEEDGLLSLFTEWMTNVESGLDPLDHWYVTDKYFYTALEAFRLGTIVKVTDECNTVLPT